MKPRVVVLVPRRAGKADRDRLWAFVEQWWRDKHPTFEIVEGHHDVGPFNRSAAINDAARRAGDWDVAVIIDADVLCDPIPVQEGVERAAKTDRMVLGYTTRHHLSHTGTQRVLSGWLGSWQQRGFVRDRLHVRGGKDTPCSSAVIVSRALWDRVEGFDERFVGWGYEDVAFRSACETLSDGPMIALEGDLYHLWHEPSSENNLREATFKRNRVLGNRYRAAFRNPTAMRRLIDERDNRAHAILEPDLPPSRIPRILHRTVPQTSEQSDEWWSHWRDLLPGWVLKTHRDPLNADEWPETSDLWEKCQNGAQLAGLIRLEALWRDGGVYVDSDVEPYRSLEPLLHLVGFAAWEDNRCVPDAVLGFEPRHEAVRTMLDDARAVIEAGGDAWHSGPGVSTSVLARRTDVLLLPPGAFYPYHYSQKQHAHRDHMEEQPWCFGAHHWNGSWLTEQQKREQRRRRRA